MAREGSLEAPTRHPIDWQSEQFYNETSLFKELERVFDICHGCRRCFNLCQSFPTLFDLIDNAPSMELDTVKKEDYWQVVDHCYLCDMCFMSKCPYVPPHDWNIDFPHLMLRAKAIKYKQGYVSLRDRLITKTDRIGKFASLPIINNLVNGVNNAKPTRKIMQKVLGIHQNAVLPKYHSKTLSSILKDRSHIPPIKSASCANTTGKVALFGTCYGEYNAPDLGKDLVDIFEHNQIIITLANNTQCCGMPKMELGDLQSVASLKKHNVPILIKLIDQGFDLVSPIPSCVLMFKQELPLLFPQDEQIKRISQAFFDPFEYLMLRHKAGLFNTEFKYALGTVSYHVACHLRVQNMGFKTREILQLIPATKIDIIERCSGHDGTYAVKEEFHESSLKICKPISQHINKKQPDYYSSDCPMAGHQIEIGIEKEMPAIHPLSLLHIAYGIQNNG